MLENLRLNKDFVLIEELEQQYAGFKIAYEYDDGLRFGRVVKVEPIDEEDKKRYFIDVNEGDLVWFLPSQKIYFYYNGQAYLILPRNMIIVCETERKE